MKEISFDKSYELFKEALKVIPGGASSNARLWRGICPSSKLCSLFVKKAKGSHIWDVDGNEYIDYRLGFGPVILGHDYEAVHKIANRAYENGLIYAFSHELEITVAKKIKSMVPCAEMIRFSNTGTESTMHAIRIARAYTKKEKILKFEGHYHGAHDYLLFSVEPPFDTPLKNHDQVRVPSSLGIPSEIKDLVVIERWNNWDIEKTFKKYAKDLAAVICEPVMGNATVIPPAKGYLKYLRQLCNKYGVLLIFDEVKTGFRLAKGGAQEIYGVKPDIATFAKSLGNGYPVAAIGGKKEIMEMVGPGKVLHGGTYASNPISLTATNATLDILNKGDVYKYLSWYGKNLMKGIMDVLVDNRINFIMNGFPEMFRFLFTNHEVSEYRDLKNIDFAFYSKLHYELLKRGVMFDEDIEEPIFTCYSHTKDDLKNTINAFEDSIKAIRK